MYFVLKQLLKFFLTPVYFLIFVTCPASFSRYLNLRIDIFQLVLVSQNFFHQGCYPLLPKFQISLFIIFLDFIIFFLFPSFFHSFSFYFLLEILEKKFNDQVPCVSIKILRQKTSSQSLPTLGKGREVRTNQNTSGSYKNVGKGFH